MVCEIVELLVMWNYIKKVRWYRYELLCFNLINLIY